MSRNTQLSTLWCYSNQLTALDVSQTQLTNLKCDDNQREIAVLNGTFNLASLPGFDPARIKSVIGGALTSGTLTLYAGVTEVHYTYDCGRGKEKSVTLLPIRTLVLPDGVTRVESEAFSNVSAQGFLLPDGIAYIAPDAFPADARLYYVEGTATAAYCDAHRGQLPKCLPYAP